MDAAQQTQSVALFLRAQGLAAAHEQISFVPLAGGVSSQIWRVDLPGRSLCVKRALPKLKVAADWQAPLSRNAFEWEWLCFAARHEPEHVPKPLAHDEAAGLFAMQFLPSEDYPVWKEQLLHGAVDVGTALQVGALLGRLHAASAHNLDVARKFDSLENFIALRLAPYLIAAGVRHPSLAPRLQELAQRTAATRVALVHGDVSPKNILVGPKGPVLLDAECAWYGDPAFDLAFCLNHLLLKCLARPELRAAYLAAFANLSDQYFAQAQWEPRAALEERSATLLPALMLARVDGKSPLEYLTSAAQHSLVRVFAQRMLKRPVATLTAVAHAWKVALAHPAQASDAESGAPPGAM